MPNKRKLDAGEKAVTVAQSGLMKQLQSEEEKAKASGDKDRLARIRKHVDQLKQMEQSVYACW